MTPNRYDGEYEVVTGSIINGRSMNGFGIGNGLGIRPVINLSYEKALYDTGDGTSMNPYKIKLAS